MRWVERWSTNFEPSVGRPLWNVRVSLQCHAFTRQRAVRACNFIKTSNPRVHFSVRDRRCVTLELIWLARMDAARASSRGSSVTVCVARGIIWTKFAQKSERFSSYLVFVFFGLTEISTIMWAIIFAKIALAWWNHNQRSGTWHNWRDHCPHVQRSGPIRRLIVMKQWFDGNARIPSGSISWLRNTCSINWSLLE